MPRLLPHRLARRGPVRPPRSRAPLQVLALVLTACGPPGNGAGPDAGPPVDLSAPCPLGFTRTAAQPAVCLETAPEQTCAPGTAPFLGSVDCAPVGWSSPCPTFFQRTPDGFGCLDTTPVLPCDGATRESVHAGACVPVGDCAAAFPPAGALLVDATFGAGQLDATHFSSVAAAVAAAPAGATVAVAPGRYVERVAVTRPLTLVGRCPAQVTLEAPAGAGPGLLVVSVAGVTVRGLTLKGFANAVEVRSGSTVTLDGVHVDQSVGAGLYVEGATLDVHASKVSRTSARADGRWGWALAAGLGATVTVDDSTLVDGVQAVFAGSASTTVTLRQTVVSRQAPAAAGRSSGVLAAQGATVRVRQSVLRDLDGDGAAVADVGGTVDLEECVVRGIRVRGSLARGHGLVAIAGGGLTARSCAVSDVASLALSAQGFSSRLEVTDTVVHGPAQSQATVSEGFQVASDNAGLGLQVLDFAAAKLDGVAILRAWGFGAYAQSSATLEARHLFIDGTRTLVTPAPASLSFGVGVVANSGALVSLTDSTVTGGSLAGLSAGRQGTVRATGVLVRGVQEAVPLSTGAGASVGQGGVLDLTRCALSGNASVSLLAVQGGGARARLVDSTVHGTRAVGSLYGHAAAAGPETSLVIDNSFFFDNDAVGLVLAGGDAVVTHSVFSRNPVALHTQDGSFLVESDDTSPAAKGELRISRDTTFLENTSKVGVGVVPVPRGGL